MVWWQQHWRKEEERTLNLQSKTQIRSGFILALKLKSELKYKNEAWYHNNDEKKRRFLFIFYNNTRVKYVGEISSKRHASCVYNYFTCIVKLRTQSYGKSPQDLISNFKLDSSSSHNIFYCYIVSTLLFLKEKYEFNENWGQLKERYQM